MPNEAEKRNESGSQVWTDRRFRVLVENSLDVIVLISELGIILYESPSVTHSFGFAPEEMIGHFAMSYAHRDDVAQLTWLFDQVLRHPERTYTGEFRHLHKDGAYTWVEGVSANLLADPEIRAIVFTFRDITARKQAAEALEGARLVLQQHADDLKEQVAERTARLEESIQALQAVLYHVAHDLRAPLRAVDGYVSLLMEGCSSATHPEVDLYGRKVLEAVERMDRLILDLLDFGRLGHVDLPLKNINLASVVSAVMGKLAPVIVSRDAEISVAPDLPLVWGHDRVVEQILYNLIDNALKFVAPGIIPRIRIWAGPVDSRIRVWVQDNGVGVPAEHQERIFRVFERLPGDTEHPGTGIGLAIVRLAAERLGGSSGVESAPGQGSRFWMELPPAHEEDHVER